MNQEKSHLPPRRIRPVALCVIWRAGQILVAENIESDGQVFYRPLGGTIEFGEHSHDTVKREMLEEIKADITHIEYLGTIETIFLFQGQTGHEIMQIYQAEFIDSNFYKQNEINGSELPDGNLPIKAIWKSLDEFQGQNALILVPDGLLDMLTNIKH